TVGFYDRAHALLIVLTIFSQPFTNTVCPHFILAGHLRNSRQLLLNLPYFFSFEFFRKDTSLTLFSALFKLFSLCHGYLRFKVMIPSFKTVNLFQALTIRYKFSIRSV